MRLFRKKSPPPLDRRDLLRARPLRNSRLSWEKMDDGEVMISIPRRNTWWVGLMARIFYVPSRRTIVLDKIGSSVWTRCDGEHTVESLISLMREEYKLERKEAEVSTLTYLKQLMEKGLIGFAVPGNRANTKP
ncbi:MAG: PqqD family protein [candidate division Zixibacteria bacterium]|nr:PqqD family protein [candidate division Zixibacteria bacterium]